MVRIAIAGNPNAGKTSVFNELTGAAQQVSNYPGVTVERKEGVAVHEGRRFRIIDLPGTYSLTAYSQEELVARNVIIDERPDLIVNVLDASNLERNLYLTVQLIEMRLPLVLALNMCDIAEKRGYMVDVERLGVLLGVPAIALVASKGKGIAELLAVCAEVLDGNRKAIPTETRYGHDLDDAIARVTEALAAVPEAMGPFEPRWAAIKMLEGDLDIQKTVSGRVGERWTAIAATLEETVAALERHCNDDPAAIVAEGRYGVAAGVVKRCVHLTGEARQNVTDTIDAVVCNRFAGPIILVGVVAALFFWIFKISGEWHWIPWFGGWRSPTGLMEWCFEALAALAEPLHDSAPALHSLLTDGIIGGVGGVMSFVPLIFIMFLFVSALEDTGYIARVAFILDRVMQFFGLQGKSILPMIVSGGLGTGGCAVPGVLATRTLRDEKDRLITMLVVPFMNCGAKMPLYAMIVAAFFPSHRTAMMLLLWAISWLVALCAAWVLRRFVFHGEQTPFVMELPPYHVPVPRGVLIHTWERTWMYIKKAGTIILAINILLWALMYFPRLAPDEKAALETRGLDRTQIAAQELAHSAAGRIGVALEPLTRFAGFDWRTNIALIGGFAAKEVVVGTLGTAYALGDLDPNEEQPLSERLAGDPYWTPLRGFALMVFVMMYAPCFVCIAVIRRESGSWKWAIFSTAYSTCAAYILATLIFQAGRMLGLG